MFYYIYIGFTASVYFILIFLDKVGFLPRKFRLFLKYRKPSLPVKPEKVKYWFHCASLGEYEMAIPLVEMCLKHCSHKDILITFFSPSGYNQAVKGNYASRCIYLPLDVRSKVKQFYKKFQPENAIFIRYELWYTLINEGLKMETDFYLVNARFSENHFLFKWYGKPYLHLVGKFSQIFTSDKKSQTLLSQHNVHSEFSGDTRFDRVESIYQQSQGLYNDIADFKGDRKLLIVGSSWEPEELLVLKILEQDYSNLAIIIAPHDLSRKNSIIDKYAKYKPKSFTLNNFDERDRLLILDTMGMLSSIYQYADIAIIGGGFNGKLHNIIEPLVQGAYPCFGSLLTKFPEAQQACEHDAAYAIDSEKAFLTKLNNLLDDESLLHSQKNNCRNYAKKHLGATSKIINHL